MNENDNVYIYSVGSGVPRKKNDREKKNSSSKNSYRQYVSVKKKKKKRRFTRLHKIIFSLKLESRINKKLRKNKL